ncbi:MAG TPA: aromatic amino acid lyase, partial [Steroidobacteraceae bacterium]|nr:aromatic amino acid lyase [Steroidobacteraceae bacterium]
NSSDHNPAVHVGLGPKDSWELATPQMMKYYVKGGPESHGQHGYIVSNANWDPYPMANKLENFVIALANMDVAVMLRIDRFSNPFFTVIKAEQVVPDAADEDWGYTPVELQEQIQSWLSPVAPSGAAIVSTVEDLQAQTLIKVQRAQRVVSTTLDLLGLDLLQAALWHDVRKLQRPARGFGVASTAAWQALRRQVALRDDPTRLPARSAVMRTVEFVHTTEPSDFAPLSLPSRSGLTCGPGSPTP